MTVFSVFSSNPAFTQQRVGSKPVTHGLVVIANYILLAVRFGAPYALGVGAITSFVVAGFLASTIIGFVVLGVCLTFLQVTIERIRG